MGYWLPPPREVVEDKSKHNFFEKGLVLLQVSWFAVQCIARWVYGLPVSLLELHTLVHVVSAMFMYVFWFKVGIYILLLQLLTEC